MSKPRVVVLGAGFGGLELTTQLSEALGDSIDVTLIDRSDSFMFGFSKLDVMFGLKAAEDARLPYSAYAKPGVKLLRRTITAIDPEARRVTTDDGECEADYLVVALGAEYDFEATPGLVEANGFYSIPGAERLRDVLPRFSGGRSDRGMWRALQVPAPSECALMLHDYLVGRGIRDASETTLLLPLSSPVPPSPETSRALLAAFAERGISFVPGRRVAKVDNVGKLAVLDDGAEMAFDLFLGVPKHRVPQVVLDSGMSEYGWIPVNPRTLETRYVNVWAVGDGAATGTPKAGMFAEGAAKAVATALLARIRAAGKSVEYDGCGTCYIEFGGGRIGKVDATSSPAPSRPATTMSRPSA